MSGGREPADFDLEGAARLLRVAAGDRCFAGRSTGGEDAGGVGEAAVVGADVERAAGPAKLRTRDGKYADRTSGQRSALEFYLAGVIDRDFICA